MTLSAITSDLILVFHIALASLARDSFRVKLKMLPSTVTSSSLARLDAKDLAHGESTDRRTDHKKNHSSSSISPAASARSYSIAACCAMYAMSAVVAPSALRRMILLFASDARV
jgi:hypothetical protein